MATTKTPVEVQQDNFFDTVLEKIKPDNEEYMERRIHHINFARIVSWLCVKSKDVSVIYPNELRAFIRVENSRVHEILKGICEAGMLVKGTEPGGRIYFNFAKDDNGYPKIKKYFERALKTLGMKPKTEITFKLEQEMGDPFL